MPCSNLCMLIAAHTYLCIFSCKVLNGENIITSTTTYFTSYFFPDLISFVLFAHVLNIL